MLEFLAYFIGKAAWVSTGKVLSVRLIFLKDLLKETVSWHWLPWLGIKLVYPAYFYYIVGHCLEKGQALGRFCGLAI